MISTNSVYLKGYVHVFMHMDIHTCISRNKDSLVSMCFSMTMLLVQIARHLSKQLPEQRIAQYPCMSSYLYRHTSSKSPKEGDIRVWYLWT